ncbi:hypothetical protein RJ640_027824, partial [Escallonia rubra]
MPESSPNSSASTNSSGLVGCTARKTTIWPLGLLVGVLAPVAVAVLLYQLDSFDPAPIPTHELIHRAPMFVPRRNGHMVQGMEKIGEGQLLAPEDIAYDPKSGVIYTGCVDGWVKRVSINESAADSVVENWVNTGGRPLGIAIGQDNEIIIADADKGLLKVTEDGLIELLTDEAEGLKFKLTDHLDIADNGIIYFTDASSKYSLHEFVWDFLDGRPNGRFLSYDPSTKHTKVLVRDLYFANGVAVSPDQKFVTFCETPMRRCTRYDIQGEREGSVDIFVDNLPGMPDNIRYDGEGQYWIAMSTETTYPWYLAQKYPFIRKIMAMMERYNRRPRFEKNGGSLAIDLEGKPLAHYYDPGLALISSGIKIGDCLYCGETRLGHILVPPNAANPQIRTIHWSETLAQSKGPIWGVNRTTQHIAHSSSCKRGAMPESSPNSSASTNSSGLVGCTARKTTIWPLGLLVGVLAPVAVAVLLYQLDSFDPAPFPTHELTHRSPMFVPRRNGHMVQGMEKIGEGQLLAPEDIAYDPKSGVIYTGCDDGWVKRVSVNESAADSVVENWVNTGGRPLGIAFGRDNEIIIADADKGLLKVTEDGLIKLLTDEAEGLKFKLTDHLDIADNGIIYFTDASSKYSLHEVFWDFLDGRPNGRFLSYDPSTKQTKVLVRDLYFANGVAVSPDQKFVIFCETTMRRCKRYDIQGEREGSVDIFVDNLPGMPDNIRYDGEGQYWIAMST